ncbi:hypothetical protein MJO28_006346 [Puccinia striiformis f. sp. tritici]|uniref:Enoyl-CoA hydratase n=2 Tax=Puccinia striiformis f. sp. tritici TaxID=168172 RepID=A0A0L0V0I9_9BASI|nr:hypothetical protein Pst134EA_011520 [Puccinia striiformis f. sp. tritici]KNE92801.1 hypothetical protein PSTG_13785 [Puccinia striiformis f. sp. tritici PST-78]KAH9467901.1 hypothetical protein Pst134EA_011520 [Puccinia striiformis f. sp. tritici]KAI7953799.1 hypothetical protein MJO28_006346 [Puccinia striiformis f. sp. tritici]KNE92802.1 hypothetical protein, variant 1 [Puccinia striiformis f. sp. tritici PST-78]KNE92803.1 hypothetical protein, variant 2 [Puccinia striiformis f. sp. trit
MIRSSGPVWKRRLNSNGPFNTKMATCNSVRPSFDRRRYSASQPVVYLDHPPENAGLEGITYLNLNRPEAKNAISMELLDQMFTCLGKVRFDGTRVLILRSSIPGSFCAGADLKERRRMSKVEVSKFLHDLRNALHELDTLPMPTIAAIDGPALGGGLELALACDLRVAGPGATKLGLTETKLGIIPGAGGTQRAARLLGISKTKDLVFGAKILDAKQALEIGLVDYVSEQVSAADHASEVARGILPNGPVAIKAAKLAINRSIEVDLETGLDLERQCYNTVLETKDRIEGLKAFNEKRKPRFTGE